MIRVKLKGNFLDEASKAQKKAKDAKIEACVAALKVATPIDTGEARDGWHREKDAIVNRVDHISHLNKGTSKQAPKYFIERTLLTQKGIFPSGTIVESI